MAKLHQITPCLWFNTQAEEAANLYVSIFPESRINNVVRYNEEGFEIHHKPAGSVMSVDFMINGQHYVALNGGPEFTFSEAISFQVMCDNQDEINYYWEKLGDGGEYIECGWLKDKFGLSWQVVPTALGDMLARADTQQAQRVTNAFLKMKKFDIAQLEKAFKGN